MLIILIFVNPGRSFSVVWAQSPASPYLLASFSAHCRWRALAENRCAFLLQGVCRIFQPPQLLIFLRSIIWATQDLVLPGSSLDSASAEQLAWLYHRYFRASSRKQQSQLLNCLVSLQSLPFSEWHPSWLHSSSAQWVFLSYFRFFCPSLWCPSRHPKLINLSAYQRFHRSPTRWNREN